MRGELARPGGADPVLSIQGLSKRYGRLLALHDLTLQVSRGEVFGFLGQNGAGKTTTVRILLDLLRPSSGRAFVLGHDCQADGLRVRRQVGYLPGELGLYGDMNGRELLDFLARLAGQEVDGRLQRRVLERLEVSTAVLRRKLRQWSSGMKRKLGIVQAFQGDPSLLILDEPTEGLDPLKQESFYELLGEAKREGRTVFMSSHVLAEVERVCDRIALLARGELVLLSSVEEVKRVLARRVRVSFRAEVKEGPARLPAGHEVLAAGPRSWDLLVRGPLGELLAALSGLPVEDLHVEEPRLEEVLLKYYRQEAT